MEKELKKLSRIELLELLIAQQEEFEELSMQLSFNSEKLASLKKENGSLKNEIAYLKQELAKKPDVDEKQIEEMYQLKYAEKIAEIQKLKDEAIKEAQDILLETKSESSNMLQKTQKECDELIKAAKQKEKDIVNNPSFLTMARIILSDSEKFTDILDDKTKDFK